MRTLALATIGTAALLATACASEAQEPKGLVSTSPTPTAAPLELSVSSPVPVGGTATAKVAGAPAESTCRIRYVTPAGTDSVADGLGAKQPDATGAVTWDWMIGASTRPGEGSVTVTCGNARATKPITIS